ncbi:glycosyltransferase involved in cell wall biosynthesis [Haloactinospora alba]|uniref:Glycosyltransferase involved in cell wall biosynthesis n=1 Tax=Haloactinospora alba TaxID=405555 RepID=A0A543N7E1_9ACTN|nr:glycosyltransferase [Haloactinospora alba]TQN27749.1 glycosyltransferase involved in cell wall biosynthesis [Haloactinospora alba]
MKIALTAEHARPAPARDGEPSDAGSVHVRALAHHLSGLGHQVTVYSRQADPDLPARARLRRGGFVEHLAAGPQRPLHEGEAAEHTGEFATALAGRFAADPPDVVHAFDWTSGLAALSAVRETTDRTGATPRVVQTFHSLNAAEQRAGMPPQPQRARMEVTLAGHADTVIVGSAEQRSDIASMGVPRQRVTVIPPGVDTDHFAPEGPTSAGPWRTARGERTRVISHAGARSGGVEALIATMARVPDAELLLVANPDVSDPEARNTTRRAELLAKEAGVDHRVTVSGPVGRDELPRLLRSADVCVSAASYDPCGSAVLEAMACGLPVAALATGGTSGAVLDGTTGILVPARRSAAMNPNGAVPDPTRALGHALGRALRGIIGEPAMRSAYSIGAIDRARSRFTWERVAAETGRVYEHLHTRATPEPVDPIAEEPEAEDEPDAGPPVTVGHGAH